MQEKLEKKNISPFQKGRGGPSSSGLQTGGLSHVTSSSGMQVTGKDRALFFRRPGMSFHRFFFSYSLCNSINNMATENCTF